MYKVTASGLERTPNLVEIFTHRWFAVRAARLALKVYPEVKVQKVEEK